MRKKNNKTNRSTTTGFIRIIAGLWKGKKLPVLDAQGLRPTTDRVKETVFNWLMFKVADRNVLDCYAGSGSLGIEALSRGAQSVTLIEKHKSTAQQLNKNIQSLSSAQIKVENQDCLTFLHQTAQQFDLVFIDPPFNCGLAAQTISALVDNNKLANNALIYLEVEKNLTQVIWPDNWQVLKEKTAGEVSYRLLSVN
ncbi:16S rRNA (guanine(966)-N(2))-methyltransferase RsmD [Algibacillus agarilyticus]|uniref:16S rRNA (guanine(966)-N(2))-methyltransferase RsmD n=1 Tax=Algibacillus agarilyticus TaxID=2234133 RepID=UPI000DD07FE6|nr:16S rRNA (guanine(966)-N(2))-methyltransferase RsmD [Algibacillus agarilyticus]